MSDKLPTAEDARRLLRETGCSKAVVDHCKTVARLACDTAIVCKENGLEVDLRLVEIGALLHDLGRSRTHAVHHAIVGSRIAKAKGVPEAVISIIKRHVGGGITAVEAEKLGWPEDTYVPVTLEEKIVSYADKLIAGSNKASIEATIANLSKDKKPEAAERVRRLHKEISSLVGDKR